MMTFLEARTVQKTALAPQAISGSAAVNGIALDKHTIGEGMFREGLFVAASGAVGGGPSSFEVAFTVEHSDDGITYAAVTDANLVQQGVKITAASQIKTVAFRPDGMKRYIRLVSDPAFTGGTTPDVLVSAVAVLGEPRTV